jgi:hypothetical protein
MIFALPKSGLGVISLDYGQLENGYWACESECRMTPTSLGSASASLRISADGRLLVERAGPISTAGHDEERKVLDGRFADRQRAIRAALLSSTQRALR